MKKSIITIISVIIVILLIVGIYFLIGKKQAIETPLSDEEKQLLINNLEIKNENIITINKNVTISANIKNNNKKQFKIQKLKVTLNNDSNELIDEFYIKIDKNIKPNKSIKFSKTIKLKQYTERVLTTYEFVI